jgi:hypothetical protein
MMKRQAQLWLGKIGDIATRYNNWKRLRAEMVDEA